MTTPLTITGQQGQVRWVYLPAVTLGPWSYAGSSTEGTLHAQVVSYDKFRVTQSPLVVVVPAGRAQWRWSVTSLQISGETLVARVTRQRG